MLYSAFCPALMVHAVLAMKHLVNNRGIAFILRNAPYVIVLAAGRQIERYTSTYIKPPHTLPVMLIDNWTLSKSHHFNVAN